MQNDTTDLDEKPLDPATEKVRKKMVRLLAVSIGLMMIGLMAVLGAIIYKFSTSGNKQEAGVVGDSQSLDIPGETLELELDLPEGAELVRANSNGAEILLHLKVKDQQELWIYNILKNKVVAKIKLAPAT